MTDKFQDEQNQLLDYMLNIYFNNYWKSNSKASKSISKMSIEPGLELFITPVCNQVCSYCYLVKHGDELYPKELRDTNTILKNLKILMNYLIERDVHLPRLDLFSGEIWGMKLGSQVFDILLNSIDQGLKIDKIIIPSNCSFITDEKISAIIDYYVAEFSSRNVSLSISASVDGAIVEPKNRPYKLGDTAQIKTEQFYDQLFKFFIKHHWGYHPMVDALTIEKQKENYVWWHDQFKKYGLTSLNDWYSMIMMLEVRNDSWTEDKIKSFLDYINFMIDYDFNEYWTKAPIEYLSWLSRQENIVYKDGTAYKNIIMLNEMHKSYSPISMFGDSDTAFSCTCGTLLAIRLGDLAILPCHRTAYPKLIYGKFNVENDKIVNASANNPFLMFSLMSTSKNLLSKCNRCPLTSYCIKGCLGSQLETTKDLFYPVESVCDLFFAKYIFMYHKLHAFVDKYKLDEEFVINLDTIDNIYKNIEEQNPEEIEKWNEFIATMTL